MSRSKFKAGDLVEGSFFGQKKTAWSHDDASPLLGIITKVWEAGLGDRMTVAMVHWADGQIDTLSSWGPEWNHVKIIKKVKNV